MMMPSNPLYPFNQRLGKLRPHVTVPKMFLLVMQGDTSECLEMLSDLLNCSDQERVVRETFPGLAEDGFNVKAPWYGPELLTTLSESQRFGYLAEVHVPETANFKFDKDGEPVRWSVHPGICSVVYCYGNTLDELMDAMEKRVAALFQKSADKARKEAV